jgi:hypothetical protein
VTLSGRRQFVTGSLSLVATAATTRKGYAADAYAQTVLAKRPVGYWRLGEKQGPVAGDSSGNGHNGTFEGNVAFNEPGAVAGDSDGAVGLDGRRAYVEIPDSVQFSQPKSGRGLSVEAWMRPDVLTFEGQTAQKYVHWLGKGESGDFEWGFRFYSLDSPSRPNRISAYIWNSSGAEGAGAYFQDDLTAGHWIHVVATFDPGDRSDPGAGVSIYRDGVQRATPSKSPGARYASYQIVPSHGSAPVRLGTRDLVSFFTGGLDDVAVYPRVLSAGEIAENFRAAQTPAG